jgi:hypothetical protein
MLHNHKFIIKRFINTFWLNLCILHGNDSSSNISLFSSVSDELDSIIFPQSATDPIVTIKKDNLKLEINIAEVLISVTINKSYMIT